MAVGSTGSKPKARIDYDALIAHADRCWTAEKENAERISHRIQVMSVTIMALLGLGLYKVEWLYDPKYVSRLHHVWVECAMKTFLVIAIVCFGAAFFALFYRKRKERIADRIDGFTSSQKLVFRPEDANLATKKAVVKRTYSAFLDLQRRNARSWSKIRRAEKWFGIGFALVLGSIMLYVVYSVPPVIGSEARDGNSNVRREQDNRAPRPDDGTGQRGRQSSSGDSGIHRSEPSNRD